MQSGNLASPESEVEWWKSRVAKLSHTRLQLKAPNAKITLGVSLAARSEAAKKWHEMEFKVSNCAVRRMIERSKNLDLRGFDPRTSSLLTRRTTDCSTNPFDDRAEFQYV